MFNHWRGSLGASREYSIARMAEDSWMIYTPQLRKRYGHLREFMPAAASKPSTSVIIHRILTCTVSRASGFLDWFIQAFSVLDHDFDQAMVMWILTVNRMCSLARGSGRMDEARIWTCNSMRSYGQSGSPPARATECPCWLCKRRHQGKGWQRRCSNSSW